MTYRGHIKDGVVVLDGNPPLEEGTVVRVEAVEQRRGRHSGKAEEILKHVGGWESCRKEVDEQLAILRQMKQVPG